MSRPMTAHDEAQEKAHQDRYWQTRVRELRDDLMHRCPSGQVLDDEHLAVLLGQAWSTHLPVQLARRFVRRGLMAAGFAAAYADRVLDLPARPEGTPPFKPLYWDPPAGALEVVPEEYRARVILARNGG